MRARFGIDGFGIRLFLTISLLFLPTIGFSQIALKGGRGLLRVQDAETVSRGDLYLASFGSTYLKKSNGSLAKDYHLTLNATYGLTSYLEVSTRFVAYQDDQKHIWGPIGDTELGLKIKIPVAERLFFLGLRNYFILPTAPKHNLPYEPFSADHVAWSPGVAASLDLTDVLYFPLKLYLNWGLIDRYFRFQNIFGEKIDQYYLGAGLKFSVGGTIFFWEYYTEQFYNRRDELSFRQNYQVSTQGITFLGPSNFIVTLAGEISLTDVSPRTFFVQKDLAKWKVWVGISKYISFRNYLSEIAERKRRQRERMEELKKQQLIKKERVTAEDELRRMQEKLKKKKKKEN